MKITDWMIVVMLGVILWSILARLDTAETDINDELYCEMTQLWNADKQKGLPPEQRNGWPAFKTGVKCHE